MSNEMPDLPAISGCPCYGDASRCICGQTEKALRSWIGNEGSALPPMTPEQREWCYAEIDSVEAHDREDYEGASDAELARGVINAWMDYCRDKGLL